MFGCRVCRVDRRDDAPNMGIYEPRNLRVLAKLLIKVATTTIARVTPGAALDLASSFQRQNGVRARSPARPVSAITSGVNAFLDRPLDGKWPYLWLDATYLKVRDGERIVSIAAIIAVAVNTEGPPRARRPRQARARRWRSRISGPAMAGLVLSSYFAGFTLGALRGGRIIDWFGHIGARRHPHRWAHRRLQLP